MDEQTARTLGIHLQWFGEDNPQPEAKPNAEPAAAAPGQGPSESSDWMVDLPEPLKLNKSLAKFSGPKGKENLAQSYLELEGKLGRSVEIPGKDAKPEDREKFLSRLGRPKTAEEYNLEAIEGFKAPEDYFKYLKGVFHKAGLSPEQANSLHRDIAMNAMETAKKGAEARTAAEKAAIAGKLKAQEESKQALQAAWGLNYESRLDQARDFILVEGGEQSLAYLEANGLQNDPVLLQLFAKAGAALAPHRLVNGKPVKPSPDHPYGYMKKDLGRT